jgi:hypothetical protein
MKLSGKGDIGTACPKCGKPLSFEDQEYDGDYILETYSCDDCCTYFSVRYRALDWEEV